jgi:rhodanese-related sulfurtransferase
MDFWITPEELSSELAGENPPLVLDVREEADYLAGHLPGAVHIPAGQLRERRAEMPKERLVVGY